MAQYYRICLFAPLLIGILTFLVPALLDQEFFAFTFFGLFYAKTPYALFVLSALAWSLYWKRQDYTLAFLVSPFLFGIYVFMHSMSPDGGLVALVGFLFSACYSWLLLILWHLVKAMRRLS